MYYICIAFLKNTYYIIIYSLLDITIFKYSNVFFEHFTILLHLTIINEAL
jgi:hypothetical protein